MRRLPLGAALGIGVAAVLASLGGCSFTLDGYEGPPLAEDAGLTIADGPASSEDIDAPDVSSPTDASDAEEEATPAKPIAFVQTNAGRTRTAGTTTYSLAFQLPATEHDSVVAAFYIGPQSATVTSVTDSLGNAYQLLGSRNVDAYGVTLYLAAAHDIKGGADTVMVNTSGVDTMNLLLHEYANVGSSIGCTQAVGDNTMTDGIASPTLLFTVPNSLIFAYAIAGTVGAGTGFATRSTYDSDITEDRIVTTPGQAAALATVTGSTSAWAIIAAGFTPR